MDVSVVDLVALTASISQDDQDMAKDLLRQVETLVKEEYGKRELLNLCAADSPEQAAELVAARLIQDIGDPDSGVLAVAAIDARKKIVGLMTCKPYVALDDSHIAAKGAQNGPTGPALMLMAELDKLALENAQKKAAEDPELQDFLHQLDLDKCETNRNSFRVIEFGRAISTKDAPQGLAQRLGLMVALSAWNRGARYACSHVNDNGLRVSHATPGSRILGSIELKSSKSLHQVRQNEPENSQRRELMQKPLKQGYRAKQDPNTDFFPTEFLILFNLKTQLSPILASSIANNNNDSKL